MSNRYLDRTDQYCADATISRSSAACAASSLTGPITASASSAWPSGSRSPPLSLAGSAEATKSAQSFQCAARSPSAMEVPASMRSADGKRCAPRALGPSARHSRMSSWGNRGTAMGLHLVCMLVCCDQYAGSWRPHFGQWSANGMWWAGNVGDHRRRHRDIGGVSCRTRAASCNADRSSGRSGTVTSPADASLASVIALAASSGSEPPRTVFSGDAGPRPCVVCRATFGMAIAPLGSLLSARDSIYRIDPVARRHPRAPQA